MSLQLSESLHNIEKRLEELTAISTNKQEIIFKKVISVK